VYALICSLRYFLPFASAASFLFKDFKDANAFCLLYGGFEILSASDF
jgi:hypothetical protein